MLVLSVIHKLNVIAEEHASSTFSVQDFHYEEGNGFLGSTSKFQPEYTVKYNTLRHTNRHTFHSQGCGNFRSHKFVIFFRLTEK